MSDFNITKYDPTRTTLMRNDIARHIRKKFDRIATMLRDIIHREDALGHTEGDPRIPDHFAVKNTRWKFKVPSDKIEAFRIWLDHQVKAHLKGKTEEELYHQFAKKGHAKGASRGFDDARKTASQKGTKEGAARVSAAKEEFTKEMASKPETAEKIKVFAGKLKNGINGEVDAMVSKMVDIVTKGVLGKRSTKVITSDLMKSLGVAKSRAETIARTEIIRFHAEGQLDAFETTGVETVGIAAEWSTAGDERVCPLCRPLEGIVLTVAEARGMIPRHPRCRCSWIPANVGENGKKQTRAKILRAIKASQGSSKWGPAKPIAAKRPVQMNARDQLSRDLALLFQEARIWHSPRSNKRLLTHSLTGIPTKRNI